MKQQNRQVADTDTVASPKKCNTLLRFSDTTKRVSINFGEPDSLQTLFLEFISKPFLKLMGFDEFQKICYRFASDPRPDEFILQKIIDSLGIKLIYNQEKLAQIPLNGPLLVVANHPLALVDGFAIASVIRNHRSDVKTLAISGLKSVPHLKDHMIRVKIGNSRKAKKRNRQATTESIKWLKDGHVLIIFPSGDISLRKHLWNKVAVDPQWSKGLGLLLTRSKANVLPVFFHGQTSFLFQFVRSIHKSLGQLLLLRELLLSRNMTIRFVLGDIVNHEVLTKIGDSRKMVDYLRAATYSLESIPFVGGRENGAKKKDDAER